MLHRYASTVQACVQLEAISELEKGVLQRMIQTACAQTVMKSKIVYQQTTRALLGDQRKYYRSQETELTARRLTSGR